MIGFSRLSVPCKIIRQLVAPSLVQNTGFIISIFVDGEFRSLSLSISSATFLKCSTRCPTPEVRHFIRGAGCLVGQPHTINYCNFEIRLKLGPPIQRISDLLGLDSNFSRLSLLRSGFTSKITVGLTCWAVQLFCHVSRNWVGIYRSESCQW